MSCVLPLILLFSTLTHAVYVSNLDAACLKCICTASTGCDENYGCTRDGGCGPFYIVRSYWEDAGKETVSSTSSSSAGGGFQACANDFFCASKIVSNLMSKHGRDCNGDGVTDCDDYARIHFLGGQRCTEEIENTSYFDRYKNCRPPKLSENIPLLGKK